MTEMTEKHHEKDAHMVEAREHMKEARKAMRKSFEALLPPGYLEHRRAARKEMLLAMHSLVDGAIARIEKKPEE